MIIYHNNLDNITEDSLNGFFDGWAHPQTPETLYKILNNSEYKILAMEDNVVVGFINAVTDKVLSAYIPLLEVLPAYKNKGIGSELIKKC